MPQQPYHVYLDLDAINNNYSAASPPQLRLEETRDLPFLDGDSSEYFCSIVRFSIQTGNSLPVFIPKMNLQGTDPTNETIYKISMVYTDRTLLGAPATVYKIQQASYTNRRLVAQAAARCPQTTTTYTPILTSLTW